MQRCKAEREGPYKGRERGDFIKGNRPYREIELIEIGAGERGFPARLVIEVDSRFYSRDFQIFARFA